MLLKEKPKLISWPKQLNKFDPATSSTCLVCPYLQGRSIQLCSNVSAISGRGINFQNLDSFVHSRETQLTLKDGLLQYIFVL
jgi:hypothetical protein